MGNDNGPITTEESLKRVLGIDTLDDALEAIANLIFTANEYESAVKGMAIVSVAIYNGMVISIQLPMGYHTVERLTMLKGAMADVPGHMNVHISQARLEEHKRGIENGSQENEQG